MEPWLQTLLGNIGGFGFAIWLLLQMRTEYRERIAKLEADHEKEVADLATQNAALAAANSLLQDRRIEQLRETIPVLQESTRALNLVANVIPEVATARAEAQR